MKNSVYVRVRYRKLNIVSENDSNNSNNHTPNISNAKIMETNWCVQTHRKQSKTANKMMWSITPIMKEAATATVER